MVEFNQHEKLGLSFDVAVVGLGPVGEIAAILLAQSGLTVLALERQSVAYSHPRVGVLDGEALRTLQKADLYERASRDMLLGAGVQWVTRHGELLATALPTEQPQGHPWLTAIYQPKLDETLRQAMGELPGIDVRVGNTLLSLSQDDDSVALQFRDSAGSVVRATASFVLGCDGASSATRDALGVELTGSTYRQPWLIIDAKLPEPVTHLPYVQFVLDPAQPRMTTRLASDNHRWERMVMPGEDQDALLAPEAARAVVAQHADPDSAEILRHVIYTFSAKAADRWRVGRVFLCGDAAHLMPPLAGQGLNSGIRDVTNLTWKVASVIGGASDSILDTYEAERRPHVEEMTRLSVRIGRFFLMQSHVGASIRDRAFRVLMVVPSVRRAVREGAARHPATYKRGLLNGPPSRKSSVGKLFPQPRVRTFDGTERRLEEVTGSGWRIVGWAADPREGLTPHGRVLAEDVLGATFVTLCAPGGRSLKPGALTDVLEDLDEVAHPLMRHQPYVIVRPDHYVYANPAPDTLETAVRQLADLVSDRPVPPPELATTVANGEVWTLDSATARLSFTARGMWGLVPVQGRFEDGSGSLTWRSDGTASVLLEVRAASIATESAIRDRHLRAADFLDVERHPRITFCGIAEQKTTGLRLTGELTIKGVATSQVIDIDATTAGGVIAGSATHSLDLRTHGIRPPLGMVRPTVELKVGGTLIPCREARHLG